MGPVRGAGASAPGGVSGTRTYTRCMGRDPGRDGRELTGEARARATVAGVVRLQLLANSLGVLAVGSYFRFLFPVEAQEELADPNLNVAAFGIYLAVMLVLALPVNALVLRRAVIWVREDTPPTRRQRKLLFNLPLAETLASFISWLGAAVLFGAINQDVQRISAGIAIAGVVTCTFLYLLLEGHFRPVYALALKDAELPADRRDVLPRLMLAWLLGSGMPLVAIGLSPIISPGELNATRLAWVASAAFVSGGLVMGVAARSVARPLDRVRRALRQIERGDLDVQLPVDDLGELGRLHEGVNHLVAGLREREQLRDVFSRQVGLEGLAEMSVDALEPGSSGELREVTVLFVDLRGYTRYSETHSPHEVVDMLNRFFRVVVAAVNREGGWVNKFEGDAALCLFGAPQDQPDHADRALRTAAALPSELAASDCQLSAGIGLATGEVVAGFVGTAERFEYTVIGDVVNLASRLCDEAKRVRNGVLAHASTVSAASWSRDWVPAGRITIRGRREKALAYTLANSQPRSFRRYGVPWASRAERSAP